MSKVTLWCLIEGEATLFKVDITHNTHIEHLKEVVGYQSVLKRVLAKDLVLYKVRH